MIVPIDTLPNSVNLRGHVYDHVYSVSIVMIIVSEHVRTTGASKYYCVKRAVVIEARSPPPSSTIINLSLIHI